MIKVTIDDGKDATTYGGKFAVIGIISDDENGDDRGTVITQGEATVFSLAFIGCNIASKIVKLFDTLEKVSTDDYR